jgi:organic radical activating enzyme
MEPHIIKDLITQASNLGVKSIAFTGGEPFLFFNSLKESIIFACKQGIRCSVATNCYWATDYKRAFKLLKSLKNAGLHSLSISTDDFHIIFTPLKFIKNALKAAYKLNLNVTIQCTLDSNSTINANYLRQEFEMDSVPIFETYVLPVGRAKNFSEKRLIFCKEENLKGSCPFILRDPVAAPNGDLAVCCGFGIGNRQGFDNLFVAGNINMSSLHEIVQVMNNNLLFNYLALKGPYSLLGLLNNQYHMITQRQFVNLCDICRLFCEQDIKKEIYGLLLKRENRIPILKKALENVLRKEDCCLNI